MDIISLVTGLFTGGAGSAVSAIGGGIIGGIASIFRLKHDYKMEQLKLDDKEKERANTLLVMREEAKNAENMQHMKIDELVTTKDYDGLISSIKSDIASYSKAFADKMSPGAANFVGILLGIVDFIRGLIRPIITVYGIYFLFNKAWSWIGHDVIISMFDDKDFARMFALNLLNACIFISTTAATWWFGSRPSKPPREIKK